MQTLNATHCTLEPLSKVHAREMFNVLSDPAIYEFENEPPQSEQWLAQRYSKLESRRSIDGSQQWLNWVILLPSGALAGYVQATVLESGSAYVAYELASRYWRQGIGKSALVAMLAELHSSYSVHRAVAVFKSANYRSIGLLSSLGFTLATEAESAEFEPGHDESVMVKAFDKTPPAA